MPRRKQSKGRLGGGDDGDPGYHSEYEGGGGGRYGVGREGDGDDTDHEDGGRGHGVDFGTETVRYAMQLEMQAIDIVDIGNVFATGNDIQTKLSQAQIDQIGDMLHGPNLGITKGTLVPYDPDATMRSLLQVPSVCIFKDEDGQPIGVYLLLKVQRLSRRIKGKSKMMMQALMVEAGKLTAGDLPAGDLPAGETALRFEWDMEIVVNNSFITRWWGTLCEQCALFVAAGPDQQKYREDLKKVARILLKVRRMKLNQNPGPPLKLKPKTMEEAEEMQNKEKADRDVRGRRNSDKRDLELMKNAEEIKEAREQNKILRDARRAAEAVAAASAAATAGPGFRGPGPPGQSSQGKGPAAAAAGEGDLPPQDQALLAQLRMYCQDPEKHDVCDRARSILGSGKRKRGKKRAKQRNGSEDESSAVTTDDDCGQRSSANILPVGSKRIQKPPPERLTMNNLVISLKDLGSVLNKGTNSRAKQNKDGPFRITFKKDNGRVSQNLDLVSVQAPWGHILLHEVHSVSCLHDDVQFAELCMEFDVNNYRTFVAGLSKDHHLVKFLRKQNIEIPEQV